MCRRADRVAHDRNAVEVRRRADRSGFTLVEVLVAFVVMTTILSVLYRSTVQTHAGALGFSARAQEEAVSRSLLAEFCARRELRDGSYAGSRDGRRWTLIASRMDLASQLPDAPEPAREAGRDGIGSDATGKEGTGKPDRPVWEMQRLVLRVATAGRPLENEALHLVRQPPDAKAR